MCLRILASGDVLAVTRSHALSGFFSQRPHQVITVELDSPVGYLPDGLAQRERDELERVAKLFPEAAILWSSKQNRTIWGYLKPPTKRTQFN